MTLVDEINIVKLTSRERFIRAALEKFPALSKELLDSELNRIAKELFIESIQNLT